MNTARIEVNRAQAETLYRQYREHRNAFTKIDGQIEAVYRQIARGRKVIRAFESIRQAGLDANGRPKLAIIRADLEWCFFYPNENTVNFQPTRFTRALTKCIRFNWPGMKWRADGSKARVPLVPVMHRPKAKLSNYHILWEADWTSSPPIDPMLLRRMSGDLWLVLAAWDLTEVERAVLVE